MSMELREKCFPAKNPVYPRFSAGLFLAKKRETVYNYKQKALSEKTLIRTYTAAVKTTAANSTADFVRRSGGMSLPANAAKTK